MNVLSIEGLGRQFGERELFRDISFGLEKGEKVALIAPNGTGKSTILKIIAGKDEANQGRVILNPDIVWAYLEQEPSFDNKLSINEYIRGTHSEVLKIIRNYEEAVAAQSETWDKESQKKYDLASALMDQHQGWDYERRLEQLLSLFKITDLDQNIGELSGGQRKRLALALVLLDNPDLLILDEPTNHLDIEMIEWLEKYLEKSNTTLLMVTHDRYFLDRICTQILELANGKIYTHQGNYAFYVEQSALREEVEQTEILKARKLMKKELEWMRRMPRARTHKSKSRIDSFYEIKERASANLIEQEINLDIKSQRIGGKIVEVKNVSKSFDDRVLIKNFDYNFLKGDRIGVIGNNGSGKSTFLNLITQNIAPDTGTIIKGETIKFGYYKQEGINFEGDQKVLDLVKETAEVIQLGKEKSLTAAQFLHHFMFSAQMQHSPVSLLSGGEKRRLYLLMVLIQNPNFLILDEPTNDLDLLTLNKLEEFLLSYQGCLMLVSHDRYFMDKLVDHIFIFDGDGSVKDFAGNYTQYRNEIILPDAQNKQKKEKEVKQQVKNAQSGEKRKLTFKELKEFEQLEKEIPALEYEKKACEEILNSGTQDYQALQTASDRISEIISALEEREMRWLELSEYLR
ncbi:MAG: ABC transporter [Bacteroidetes bacterium HGW-Bacteroidetes-17]|jgi:ATP-binding cassette subfamily F protein uup|nr:MAG: ABC transporter [Bacteroidetes bacterium HGW-Bacteroidetes-17]